MRPWMEIGGRPPTPCLPSRARPVRDWELRRVPDQSSVYWVRIRKWAARLDSDGCSGVLDFYLDACLEHDCHYRTRHTLEGLRVSRRQSDMRFRRVIQARSPFGYFSPMSWERWLGLRVGGRPAWLGMSWWGYLKSFVPRALRREGPNGIQGP